MLLVVEFFIITFTYLATSMPHGIDHLLDLVHNLRCSASEFFTMNHCDFLRRRDCICDGLHGCLYVKSEFHFDLSFLFLKWF